MFQWHKSCNPFRKMDLFVGAPLFMDRGSDGKLREVGQVYVYLGKGGFTFNSVIKFTGSEIYARYGSSVCSVGDLNMDGYNGIILTPDVLCVFIQNNFLATQTDNQYLYGNLRSESVTVFLATSCNRNHGSGAF